MARTVTERESERGAERERDLCTRKVITGQILFKMVSFKASFEGREGRAVTESERKRIPDFVTQKSKTHDHRAVFF